MVLVAEPLSVTLVAISTSPLRKELDNDAPFGSLVKTLQSTSKDAVLRELFKF
jgi:hypothetical protein